MGFKDFLHKIGNGFKTIGHTIGNTISGGYHSVKNVASGIEKTITTQINNVHDNINHIVDKVTDLGGKVVQTGGSLVQNAENKLSSTFTMPLILIAGGLAAFLVLNRQGITDVAQTAVQKI
jgi:hypothetical protein